jgi:GMP reductase
MRIKDGVMLDFKDVLILPKRSTLDSRSQVNLERTYHFRNSNRHWTGIPIMISNMDTTGTFSMAHIMSKLKILTCIHKFYSIHEWTEFLQTLHADQFNHVVVSSGIADGDFDKLDEILSLDERLHWICLDVANGYMSKFIEKCKQVRDKYPEKIIIAGNICTSEGVLDLVMNGMVDIVKVGIGNGSCCTTRKQTGIGMPQLSAVIECADNAHGLNAHIISDGGLQVVGDFSKAYAGGADFVMSGSMFAGHAESGGELVTDEKTNEIYKVFYGMSSTKAMEKYSGGVAKYRSSEGKAVKIAYRGPVENTILDIQGGIRSCMTYLGAKKIKDIPKCATFVRVNRQLNQIYNGREI